MRTDPMISTKDLRVDYDDVTAVRDLNLSIGPGEVFGLIGPNGAGKSSAIRVLATLLEPTYGDVHIGAIDVAEYPRKAHEILGYMPDMAPVDGDLRCWEFLDLFAGAHFLSRRERKLRVAECLDRVDLTFKHDALAGTLSRGMTQRLVLAKTLLHRPSVLLLDEPASGLDPMARIELRELLKSLSAEGKTVLISSHILTELEGFCTSIGIMEKGELKISGDIGQIVKDFNQRRRMVVVLQDSASDGPSRIGALPRVSDVIQADGRIEFDFDGDEAQVVELLRQMIAGEIPVQAFYEDRMGVEDIMLKIGAKEVS
jgi:ABC-2 type transport system ATP-binding protein